MRLTLKNKIILKKDKLVFSHLYEDAKASAFMIIFINNQINYLFSDEIFD